MFLLLSKPFLFAGSPDLISLTQLRTLQTNFSEGLIIVDVTSSIDYEKGHIEGAVNIPWDASDDEYRKLRGDKMIVTYCHCGNEAASARRAAEKFIKLGFPKVAYLGAPTGAFMAYKNAGYPLAGDVKNGASASAVFTEFTQRVSSQVFYSELSTNGDKIIVVDLRRKEAYEQEHIEGALNFSLDEFFSRDAGGKYVFEKFPRGKEIFFYCEDEFKSEMAARKLKDIGYIRVYYIEGGFRTR
jgi:rhodanese-related sulfurtransferase